MNNRPISRPSTTFTASNADPMAFDMDCGRDDSILEKYFAMKKPG